jgi:hypothetical protein
VLERLEERCVLSDVSAPAILQVDDASYANLENRAADLFNAGYGALLTPPPGRADSGNQSVGYDVYDRFDLGAPYNHTLYGTELGLKTLVSAVHQAGDNYYSDLVWNHDGFSDLGTPGFAAAGGYPGFALTLNPGNNSQGYNDIDGDFHSAFDNTLTGMRLSGLIDIAQEKNYQFIRSPVTPGDPRNLPAGTTPAYGRLANVPDPNNARFYPDQSLQPIVVFDPTTGEQNIHIYPFNNANPLNGTPTPENGLGYLMRYAQWMVQYVGADGFRIDAAKSMPPWVLNYLDRAVYRSSFRTLLNGSQENVFSFGEVFDGDKSFIQQFIRKDINPADPGTIGGNRDALDFPLFFAMQQNLSGNGLQNDWTQVVNASQDVQDDGLANNGSQGVAFVSSHDSFGPYLSNVAYAYMLMRPGNAIVYFNAHEFGNRDFPKDGRGDALGGLYGNTITTLVNIRDTHPQGNYTQRDLEKETLIFERNDDLLFAASNRLDNGFDSRTVQTAFPPGTPLIELTGNATDPNLDPDQVIPPLLVVNGDGTVNLRVPRNRNDNGVETDKGYVIYAPSGPQGSLSLTNVDHVIPGQTPTPDTNGTARLSSIPVITGNTFQIQLNTNQVNLLGSFRDHDADGDNALFKIDSGVDATGNGFVDTNPGDVAYGFQAFTTVHSTGYFNASGNGQYVQTIDVSKLGEGMHYITVRAFRHRNGGEPPIFTDFRQAIYIDRTPTVSAVVSFDPVVAGVNENRRLTVQSTDLEANNVHVFFDLPAGLTNAQVLAMVGGGSQSSQIDRNLWIKDVNGLTSGNHVATVVSYEISGNVNVQRFPGLFTSTIFGAGLGDLNFDGQYTAADVNLFGQVLNSNNAQFNPAADLNGDGKIDNADPLQLYPRLQAVGANPATFAAYNALFGIASSGFTDVKGNPVTLTLTPPSSTTPALTYTWDLNHDGTFGDSTGSAPTVSWAQLMSFGITNEGVYPIAVRISDGLDTVTLNTTLTVIHTPPTVTASGPTAAAEGTNVSYTGSFTDPLGLSEAPYSYTWSVTASNGQVVAPASGSLPAPGAVPGFSFTAQGGGTYTVTLTIQDVGGVSASSSVVLSVPDVPPAVTFTVGPTSVSEGTLVTYGASFTDPGGTFDGPYTYTWSVSAGNGQGVPAATGTVAAPGAVPGFSFTAQGAGSYTVTLTVRDGQNASGSGQATLTATNVAPAVTFTASPATADEGTAVTFSAGFADPGGMLDGPYSFTWNVVAGNGQNVPNLTGTVTAPGPVPDFRFTPQTFGTYTVTLVVKDRFTAAGSSQATLVVVNVPPAVNVTGPTSGLEGSSLPVTYHGSFTDPGGTSDAPYTYTWTVTADNGQSVAPAGGTVTAPGAVPDFTFTPRGIGSYVVTLTVTERSGAAGTQQVTLVVPNVPPQVTAAGPPGGPEGQALAFTGSFTDPGGEFDGPFTYTWSATAANGQSVPDQTGLVTTTGAVPGFTFTPQGAGSYTVTLSVRDHENATGSQQLALTVSNIAPAVTVGGPSAGPEGTVAVFRGSFTDPGGTFDAPYTYTWSVTADNGQSVPGATGTVAAPGAVPDFSLIPPATGHYTVTLAVQDRGGATGTAQAALSATNVPPTVAITGAPAHSPEGTPLSLAAAVTDPTAGDTFTYAWSVTRDGTAFASGTQADFSFTPDNDGTYVVTLAVTDRDGGVGRATATVAVDPVPPTLTLGGAASVLPGAPYRLSLAAQEHGTDVVTSWTVRWGDGSSDVLPGTATSATHTYPLLCTSYTVGAAAADEDGTTNAGNPVTVRAEFSDPNQCFLAQVYFDLLGRYIDAGGLAYWAGLLDASRVSRTQVAQAVESTAEYREAVVQGLFVNLLQRPADAASLAAGASFLGAGGTVAQLEALLLGSEEYFQKRGGGTVNGFLTAVYQDLFHQGPDAAGAQYWQQVLANGAPRSAVALTLLGSTAADRQALDDQYNRLVRRPIEAGGRDYWTQDLQQGVPLTAVITALVASGEYFDRL